MDGLRFEHARVRPRASEHDGRRANERRLVGGSARAKDFLNIRHRAARVCERADRHRQRRATDPNAVSPPRQTALERKRHRCDFDGTKTVDSDPGLTYPASPERNAAPKKETAERTEEVQTRELRAHSVFEN